MEDVSYIYAERVWPVLPGGQEGFTLLQAVDERLLEGRGAALGRRGEMIMGVR